MPLQTFFLRLHTCRRYMTAISLRLHSSSRLRWISASCHGAHNTFAKHTACQPNHGLTACRPGCRVSISKWLDVGPRKHSAVARAAAVVQSAVDSSRGWPARCQLRDPDLLLSCLVLLALWALPS